MGGNQRRVRVAGVDATKRGWVAIVLEDGRFTRDHLLDLDTRFAEIADAEVVGIDIPIGFGPRAADSAARDYLRGAASTVFSAPPRAVLGFPYGPGLGVTAQAHALGARMIQVTKRARRDHRIREVHPEVSFRAMNEAPLRFRKRSAGGSLERLALLALHGIQVGEVGEAARAPLDDVLDAAAAAWSAYRIALGEAASLPDPPETRRGRKVAIWY